jgi:hypothetical protein
MPWVDALAFFFAIQSKNYDLYEFPLRFELDRTDNYDEVIDYLEITRHSHGVYEPWTYSIEYDCAPRCVWMPVAVRAHG